MLTFNFSANVSHMGLGYQRVNDPGHLVCSSRSGLHKVCSNNDPDDPHSHCADVATVHPDAGQPVYPDAPGHIS